MAKKDVYIDPKTGKRNRNCVDCGVAFKWFGTKRCRTCAGKYQSTWRVGENNFNFIHGKTNHNKCIDCGTHITQHSTRCGTCYGKIQARRQEGENNHHFKHGRTLEHKCVDCDTPVYYYSTRCIKCAGKYRSKTKHLKDKPKLLFEEYSISRTKCIDCGCVVLGNGEKRCRDCYALFSVGENSPSWLGGVSFEPYTLQWTNKLKESIRARDGYKCQECGIAQSECDTRLHVHHIDYDKKNSVIENLISLCDSCHGKICMRPSWAEPKYREIVKCLQVR